MRVLFVHAKINYDTMEPLGLLSLATSTRAHGHTVQVLDIFPDDTALALQRARSFAPDIVGYSIESPAFSRIAKLHAELKKHLPRTLFCGGGIHPSVLPEETLRHLHLDYVLIGEAEQSFPALLSRLREGAAFHAVPGSAWLQDGTYHAEPPGDPIADLDTLPIPDRSLIYDYPFYLQAPGNIRGLVIPRTATIMATRGCPFRCTFCVSHRVQGRSYRRRSVEHVMEEIALLRSRYGINGLYFADDSFTIDKRWLFTFCEAMRHVQPGLRWACQSRADGISPHIAQAMAAAGCVQVDMGVESADPAVLRSLRKGETIEQLFDAARMIHAARMRLLCSFVIGAPEESWQSILMTRDAIRRLRPDMCQYFSLVPYPGTKLADSLRDGGVSGPVSYDERFSQKGWDGPLFPGGLDPRHHLRAKKLLQRTTLLRDHLPLVTGWFRYPRELLRWLAVAARNGFFLPVLLRMLFTRNPVDALQEIYRRRNRFILRRTRGSVDDCRKAVIERGEEAADDSPVDTTHGGIALNDAGNRKRGAA
jgi:radical SAM superfamily enzyme YgiQ (UPF0313 family)